MPTIARRRPKCPNRKLGEQVYRARCELGMGLREFATHCDIRDFTMIYRLEKGQDVRASALLKIMLKCGIPMR